MIVSTGAWVLGRFVILAMVLRRFVFNDTLYPLHEYCMSRGPYEQYEVRMRKKIEPSVEMVQCVIVFRLCASELHKMLQYC